LNPIDFLWNETYRRAVIIVGQRCNMTNPLIGGRVIRASNSDSG
jgi:hypothetical protein